MCERFTGSFKMSFQKKDVLIKGATFTQSSMLFFE